MADMETDAHRDALNELAGSLRDRLLREAGETAGDADLQVRIGALVDREAGLLDEDARARVAALIAEHSFGLGPLEALLADPEVDEVMVNGPGRVWVERRGRIEATDVAFASGAELRHAIERILAPLGRRVDEACPLVDARLPDGSRVNVIIPPLALEGPVLTIRRFHPRGLSPDDLVEAGTLTAALRDFLARCVRSRCNLLVSGGTGTGKTTLLNALSRFIPDAERVVTVEDAAELRLQQPHVVRLETRPPNLEGRGEVTVRALVRNALRMRPDRIIVGEVRGAEALDMLGAMTSGHDGSLSTVHAGSPPEAIRRVETLALMADVGLPHAAVREQVAGAIDVVAHLAREREGQRRLVAVSEVVRVAGGAGTRELYSLRGGRPRWRAALSDELAGRLAAAA